MISPVDTAYGPMRLHVHAAVGPMAPRAVVMLGHGAGGGIEARDLSHLARVLPRRGFTVVLVEQPWRVAGRRVAAVASQLDAVWRCAVQWLSDSQLAGLPLVVGGRSSGARVACRTAADTSAVGVLALAFPLRPPWRPESSRVDELPVDRPVLIVQGGRDEFGQPADFRGLPGDFTVATVPFADHEFAVTKGAPVTQGEGLELLNDHIERWLDQVLIRESAATHARCRLCGSSHRG